MRYGCSLGNRDRWLLLGLVLSLPTLLLTLLMVCEAVVTAGPPTGRQFRPRRVIPVQPAIKNAPVVAADRVRGQVTETELVLGVVIEGEARAYPINMLTGPRREIINDTLGGVPVAATW